VGVRGDVAAGRVHLQRRGAGALPQAAASHRAAVDPAGPVRAAADQPEAARCRWTSLGRPVQPAAGHDADRRTCRTPDRGARPSLTGRSLRSPHPGFEFGDTSRGMSGAGETDQPEPAERGARRFGWPHPWRLARRGARRPGRRRSPVRVFGLSEEEPMPPRRGKAGVGSINVLADRQTIEGRKLAHDLRMVEREPKGVVAAAVVASRDQTGHAQAVHRRKQVTCAPARFECGRWSAVGAGLSERP